jgi:hypothetical protein
VDDVALHHIALRVKDCERAALFYRRLTGAKIMTRVKDPRGRVRAVWVRTGDLILMLERRLRGAGPRVGSGHVLVFGARSLPAAERNVSAAGASVTDRTEATLFTQDPDGHRVGLSIHRF